MLLVSVFMCMCSSAEVPDVALLPAALWLAGRHCLRPSHPSTALARSPSVAGVGRSSAELGSLFAMSSFLVKNLSWAFIYNSYFIHGVVPGWIWGMQGWPRNLVS